MAKDKDELFAETPTKKLTAEEQLKEDARKQVEEELKQKKEDSGDHTFTANKIFEDELVKERLKAGLLVRRYVDREITINSTLRMLCAAFRWPMAGRSGVIPTR